MDDHTGVAYPSEVHLIDAEDPASYREAAGLIESSGAEAIWLQHEFGIFGGEAGSHILALLERSTLPVLATLHTVTEQPSDAERLVLERLIARCSRFEVMAERGREILVRSFGVEPTRITVNPHGVPDRPFLPTSEVKASFGLAGRKVIMTFGLLAPDKGIRHMIEAMPAIVAEQPDACYIVLGSTHPNLVRIEGEAHREALLNLAQDLGVGDHVRFIDAFLEEEELLDWLQAADVYVTPYLNLRQVTSGTLAYAVAIGKPVVATPYVHATEILSDDHGVLVPPRDSAALAKAVGGLLSNDSQRLTIAARAYERGRAMLWPRAAERSVSALQSIATGSWQGMKRTDRSASASMLKRDAVVRMTDSTGMIQHAIYSVPNRAHGYCIDDNARALILTCQLGADGFDPQLVQLATTYAAFMQDAWNEDAGRFRNFMSYDRRWLEDEGSEDSNGRALWALGCAAAQAPTRALRDWALELYGRSASIADGFQWDRALAFAALGASEIHEIKACRPQALALLERVGDHLTRSLEQHARENWHWFEPTLSYDNARLPEALIRCGMLLERAEMLDRGVATLDWLMGMQTSSKGVFRPVGNDSFGRSYSSPLPFDQQPVDVHATVDACVAAYRATGDERWMNSALSAYGWFFGDNDSGIPLATREDGGCFDGLMPTGVNRNQGAESILALQLASVTISGLSLHHRPVKEALDAA